MNLHEPNDLIIQRKIKNEDEGSIDVPNLPNILIIGVGGAGNNCIHQLNAKGVPGAKTIAINTDKQQLDSINADYKILIGRELAHGMGVGGDPVLGSQCAKASETDIEGLFDDVELVFLIAGMGGGTGTGAAPVIADLARGLDTTVIGLVTIPFYFEFGRKLRAKRGIRQMAASTHSLLVIDNNRLLGLVPDLPLDKAFNQINDLITEVVSGITETMTKPSLINLDFADIKTIMRNGNQTLLCYGESDSLDPDEIVKNTLNNPLLNLNYNGANNALIHITGGPELSLELTDKITKRITRKLNPKANVILGARINPEFKNEVKLLTIMTGVNDQYLKNQFQDFNSTSKYSI
ncbi:MAG: cell division protein FtsZ [Candidatus Thorarchaeota archaeon]